MNRAKSHKLISQTIMSFTYLFQLFSTSSKVWNELITEVLNEAGVNGLRVNNKQVSFDLIFKIQKNELITDLYLVQDGKRSEFICTAEGDVLPELLEEVVSLLHKGAWEPLPKFENRIQAEFKSAIWAIHWNVYNRVNKPVWQNWKNINPELRETGKETEYLLSIPAGRIGLGVDIEQSKKIFFTSKDGERTYFQNFTTAIRAWGKHFPSDSQTHKNFNSGHSFIKLHKAPLLIQAMAYVFANHYLSHVQHFHYDVFTSPFKENHWDFNVTSVAKSHIVDTHTYTLRVFTGNETRIRMQVLKRDLRPEVLIRQSKFDMHTTFGSIFLGLVNDRVSPPVGTETIEEQIARGLGKLFLNLSLRDAEFLNRIHNAKVRIEDRTYYRKGSESLKGGSRNAIALGVEGLAGEHYYLIAPGSKCGWQIARHRRNRNKISGKYVCREFQTLPAAVKSWMKELMTPNKILQNWEEKQGEKTKPSIAIAA